MIEIIRIPSIYQFILLQNSFISYDDVFMMEISIYILIACISVVLLVFFYVIHPLLRWSELWMEWVGGALHARFGKFIIMPTDMCIDLKSPSYIQKNGASHIITLNIYFKIQTNRVGEFDYTLFFSYQNLQHLNFPFANLIYW